MFSLCQGCERKVPLKTSYCYDCKSKRNRQKSELSKNSTYRKVTQSGSWAKARKAALNRDNHCCQLCLHNGFICVTDLQVHHIVKVLDDVSKSFDLKNLITLCVRCHSKVERNPRLLSGLLED